MLENRRVSEIETAEELFTRQFGKNNCDTYPQKCQFFLKGASQYNRRTNAQHVRRINHNRGNSFESIDTIKENSLKELKAILNSVYEKCFKD